LLVLAGKVVFADGLPGAVEGIERLAVGVRGYAVASICSFIGGLGILAGVAGIAILLYMIFKPQKNPVQQFTSDYAAPAGFFMPYGSEIDYFNGYAPDGEPTRLGCSFVVSATPPTVLSVASDGTTVGAAAESFGYNSVFVISTDGTGQSRVITLVQNSSGGLETKVLTWATDNTVSFQTRMLIVEVFARGGAPRGPPSGAGIKT
jgi:hypothetical protein